MTHRDGLPRFSARSAPGGHGGCPPGSINAGGAPATPGGGDAGHREACATPSESLGKPSLWVMIGVPWYHTGSRIFDPSMPQIPGCPPDRPAQA